MLYASYSESGHFPHAMSERIVAILKNGGVIVYPTDTIYGIGCDVHNAEAIEKIYRIKQRDKKKPLSILCADITQAAQYGHIPDYAYRLMKRTLPGPYTYILRANKKTPARIITNKRTVGVRIPDHELCIRLVQELGNPIITTSVNISGKQPVMRIEDIPESISNQLDAAIDAGPLENEASTIIDVTGDAPVVLREGKGPLEPFGL